MKRSSIARLAAITAAAMLTAFGTLNSGVGTRPARAFTVLTVTNTNDSGPGSLRDTVGFANPGDTVIFSLTLPATITLTSGEIGIVNNLTITGPGPASLTISGNNASRIFDISSGNVTLSGLTIANGSADVGGGAGVANGGTLSVSNCTFSNCSTAGAGGGILNNFHAVLSVSNCTFNNNNAETGGGAIFNQRTGTLNVQASTFSGNLLTSGAGGAILNEDTGTLNVQASTFSNNSAQQGGAIRVAGGAATVVNCTFSGNLGITGGGAISIDGGTVANCTLSGNTSAPSGGGSGFGGGGILVAKVISVSPPAVNLQNIIIAHSTTGGDCVNQGMIGVNSHNLIQDGSCSPMLSGDPMLGPLQNNGGPTLTMALLAGSPAIDQGDDSVLGPPLSLTTDQRGPGFPRKSGAHVDIGAFEAQVPVPVGPSFDSCLKDNTTGNLLQWNSTTGQYQLTRCSDNFTLSGTGTVALVNGIRTLRDFKTDRRISAGFNTGQLTGNATIYLMVAQGVWQTFRIIDTNPSAVCKC